MPKRIKTPPLAEEAKYLTVVHPFPLAAHWELIGDRQEFARWLSCVLPNEHFPAFYYKPKARDMVIIEVLNTFTNWESLLGEHTWSDFLRNPTEEQASRKTKVFYCRHSTGREVQKHGWLEVRVKEKWFNKWSPNNSIINFPYPPTKWCDLPIEDKTNEPLCRPLPQKIKPVAAKPPPKPVVGSANWASAKVAPPPSRGVWGKGALKSLASPSTRPQPSVVSPIPVRGGSGHSWASASSAVTSPPVSSHISPPGLTRNSNTKEQLFHVTVSESMQDALAAMSLAETGENPDVNPSFSYVASDEAPRDWGSSPMEEENDWGSAQEPPGNTEVFESLWGDEQVEEPEVELCKDHGTLCKRGICKERARMYREAERAKAMGENKLNTSGSRKPPASTRGWNNLSSSTNSNDNRSRNGSNGYNNSPNNRVSTRKGSNTSSGWDDNESVASGVSESTGSGDDDFSAVSSKGKGRRAASVAGSESGWSTVNTPWGR